MEDKNSKEMQKVIKIVIVEDFKLTRVGLRCALNANDDMEVVAESENAIDGVKYVERYRPDVVLMDLGLPGMNGIEAMIKIKEFAPETKIIALTSHDRAEEVVAALSSGASAYCLKDIDPQKLADVVRDVSIGVCWIDPVVAQLALNSFPKVENVGFFLRPSACLHGGKPAQLLTRNNTLLKGTILGNLLYWHHELRYQARVADYHRHN